MMKIAKRRFFMATKIYIDQGHNPVNPNAGAEGNGYREQDITFEIGRRLAAILNANGFETRLSRPTEDTQLGNSVSSSLAARVGGANSWGADYFVSLHTNASVNPQASGTEVLVYSQSSPAYELARSVLEQLRLSTGLRSRGVVTRPGLYVLRKTAMPAILVEMGFITNPEDASLMVNSPELFARGIADGIIDFVRRSVPSFSPVQENAELPEELENNSGEVKDEEDQIYDADENFEAFIAENSGMGSLKLQAFRGEQAFPVSGVSASISRKIGDSYYIFFEGETDESGIIDGIELPAPPVENSTEYGRPNKAAIYILSAKKKGYDTIEREIEIYDKIKTIQPLRMTQRYGGIYGTSDNS